MAIADTQYRFVAVDIGAYGWSNDSRIFKNSALGRRLYTGNFNIPAPRPLPGTEAPLMPYVVMGDEPFQMCPNLIKPYSIRFLNYRQRIFNYRLSRARHFVKCAFRILVAKWRILTTCIQLNPDAVDDVVKACIILHNYILHKEPLLMIDYGPCPVPPSVITTSRRSARAINKMRDHFSEYFISTSGWVDWQKPTFNSQLCE